MPRLEISAKISAGKSKEFNEAKHSFYESIQKEEGYIGYTEKQCNHFCLVLDWEGDQSVNEIMQSEVYRIFHGAIITLSEKNSIKINISNQ